MTDLSQFAPTPAQMKAIGIAFERFGHEAQRAVNSMVEAFAVAARKGQLHRQQADRDPTHFGRKRRARRARGRR